MILGLVFQILWKISVSKQGENSQDPFLGLSKKT